MATEERELAPPSGQEIEAAASSRPENPTAADVKPEAEAPQGTSGGEAAMVDNSAAGAESESLADAMSEDNAKKGKPDPVSLQAKAVVSDLEKKQRRAERFGVGVNLSEQEKRKLRASRFSGLNNGSSASMKEEQDKRSARAARFGLNAAPAASDADEESKKKARLSRFGGLDTDAEAEKKKARAERFGASNNDANEKKKLRPVATAAQG